MNMKMILWRLANVVARVVHPSFWFQNHKTDYKYDAELRKALDKYGVSRVDRYNCDVGGQLVWICNYPYAFGSPGGYSWGNSAMKKLPSVLTRMKLKAMVEREYSNLWDN